MKHTKNILKSLLITVMALSLLAVSCKKDEGGSKPTDPTTVTISAADLTSTLKGLKAQKADAVQVDFSTMTEPSAGKATIDNAESTFADVREALITMFTALANNTLVEVTTDLTDSTAKPANKDALKVNLTIKAKNGNQLASDMGGYTYNDSDKTAKLEISITPQQNWQ